MNIFIIGSERCGKSSAAQFLSEGLTCSFAETGRLVIEQLAKLYAAGSESPKSVETWTRLISLGKAEFRSELNAIGELMVSISPSFLIDECAKRSRIVVGVRRRREVLGYFQRYGRRGWRSIWIKVVSPQPALGGSCYELTGQPCDYEVANSGDLSELQQKMHALARVIRAKYAA